MAIKERFFVEAATAMDLKVAVHALQSASTPGEVVQVEPM